MTNQADELMRRLREEAMAGTEHIHSHIRMDYAEQIIRETLPEPQTDEETKENVRLLLIELSLNGAEITGRDIDNMTTRILTIMRPKPVRRITGRDVHREWRDGMLAQKRMVFPYRMSWETLSEQDRELDDGIAARLSVLRPEPGKEIEG